MRVELAHVIVSRNQEEAIEVMDFPNAKRASDKIVQTWVKKMSEKYSKNPDYQDTEDEWYEFRYKKLTKVKVPSGVWEEVQTEFLNDKI